MSWSVALLLAIGGALGTLARYAIQVAAAPFSRSLPWGTIGINIVGSFVIGFAGTLTMATGRYPVPDAWRLFIMAGLCGGFTTFSAFSLQTLDLLRAGAVWRAGANVALSVVACVVAVGLGHVLAVRLNAG